MDTILGGTGNDTITAGATNATTGAAATNLSVGDSIDGGDGRDTLNITMTAANNNSLAGVTVKNVEVVNLTGANNLGTTKASAPAVAAGEAQVLDFVVADPIVTSGSITASVVINGVTHTATYTGDSTTAPKAAAIKGIIEKVLGGTVTVTVTAAELLVTSKAIGMALPTITATANDGASSAVVAAITVDAATGNLNAANASVTAAAAVAQIITATLDDGNTDDFATATTVTLYVDGVGRGTISLDGLTETAAAVAIVTELDKVLGEGVASSTSGQITITAPVAGVPLPHIALTLAGANFVGDSEAITFAIARENVAVGAVTQVADKAATVAATAFTGAEQIWLRAGSGNTEVTGITTQTIGLATAMNNTLKYGSTTSEANLYTLAGSTDLAKSHAVTLSGTALETVNLTGTKTSALALVNSDVETLNVNTSGSTVLALAGLGGLESVNSTGAGALTLVAPGSTVKSITTGSGNDTIIMTRALTATDKINTGGGLDTVSIIGKTLTGGDYAILDAALTNVEVLNLRGDSSVDASKISQVALAITNAGDSSVTEASSVALTYSGTSGDTLTASSTDYVVAASGVETVYGGNLNITHTSGAAALGLDAATSSKLVLNGNVANVTVNAAAGAGAMASTITGDLKALNVTLVSGANATKSATGTDFASTVINLTGGAGNLAELTTLTLKGNGSATVTNIDTANTSDLTIIDASGLTRAITHGTSKGDFSGTALTFIGAATIAETITLGAGKDSITAASTYGKMDTIIGFDAVKETDNDKSVTDILVFGSVTLDGSDPNEIAKVTLSSAATTLGLAFIEADAASQADSDNVKYFHFAGDTYLVKNVTNGALVDADLAIKLTGVIDFASDWGVYGG